MCFLSVDFRLQMLIGGSWVGVLVEVGFSLIPVNQGVWGRAPTAGGPHWRRNRKIAIRVKNKTYMTERIRKARSPYFVQYYPKCLL